MIQISINGLKNKSILIRKMDFSSNSKSLTEAFSKGFFLFYLYIIFNRILINPLPDSSAPRDIIEVNLKVTEP